MSVYIFYYYGINSCREQKKMKKSSLTVYLLKNCGINE